MPELPEVEIGARNLRRWIGGAVVVTAHIGKTRIVRGNTPANVRAALEGRRVASIDRCGKWVRLTLDDGSRVFSHFGMTGKWVRRAIDAPEERWERVRIDVEKRGRRTSVRYVDPRMFGHLVVAEEDIAAWRALGPDPLVDGIDRARLGEELARRKISVKEAIMDQRVLAGVGNIQATEALFLARIDPRRVAKALTEKEHAALAKAIARSIDEALAHEGGDEITYVEEAGAPNPFRIYGREGEPCPRCKTPLKRVLLGGRASAFCGKCQK